MVATDGRRLTAANSLTLPIKQSVIVPRNKFLAWPKLTGATQAGFNPKKGWMRLVCGSWEVLIRLIEGTYPNWQQVVPDYTEDTTYFTLAEEDVPVLLDALKTMPSSDESTRPITVMTGTPHLRLAACDPESGHWSYQVLPNSRWDGTALSVTVNRSFLADAVKAGFRTFSIADDLSPLLARDNGNTHVLMPVRGNLPPEIEELQAKRQGEPAEADTGHEAGENETKTQTKETNRMIQPKTNGRTDDQTPDLWSQYQTVKEKARELNSAIAELGQSIKGFHKEQKTVRTELDNARGVLAKLQSINI